MPLEQASAQPTCACGGRERSIGARASVQGGPSASSVPGCVYRAGLIHFTGMEYELAADVMCS